MRIHVGVEVVFIDMCDWADEALFILVLCHYLHDLSLGSSSCYLVCYSFKSGCWDCIKPLFDLILALSKRSQLLMYLVGWVGLWGFLWWAPSAKRKDHHRVSSGLSSVWHCSNTDLSSSQYEQIPIILGVWPFCLTPFFFSVNNILAGLWLNHISSVEITLFLLADILLQHRALFQY